jgi:hypothetical protein
LWAYLHIIEPLGQNYSKLVSKAAYQWTSWAELQQVGEHREILLNLSGRITASFWAQLHITEPLQ